jgi:hypothetical protein
MSNSDCEFNCLLSDGLDLNSRCVGASDQSDFVASSCKAGPIEIYASEREEINK